MLEHKKKSINWIKRQNVSFYYKVFDFYCFLNGYFQMKKSSRAAVFRRVHGNPDITYIKNSIK